MIKARLKNPTCVAGELALCCQCSAEKGKIRRRGALHGHFLLLKKWIFCTIALYIFFFNKIDIILCSPAQAIYAKNLVCICIVWLALRWTNVAIITISNIKRPNQFQNPVHQIMHQPKRNTCPLYLQTYGYLFPRFTGDVLFSSCLDITHPLLCTGQLYVVTQWMWKGSLYSLLFGAF